MNARCFKTVFSKRLGARVAVGEHASSQGKATGAGGFAGDASQPGAFLGCVGDQFEGFKNGFWGVLSSTFALVALVWATPAWAQPAPNALPTGGQVVQGAVQFNQSAQQLNITQSTDRAAVNWQSFDIGTQAKVQVHQPSAQSVLLNRVGGESPSQIFGQLQANGKVILVNPNGLVIGRDGSVSAAGFTGSTLNISDADFMAGQARFSRSGAGTGSVLNQGRITAAPGGYVALLGASVSNEGQIIAPQGHVFMAAADGVNIPAELPGPGLVAVPLGSSGRIRLELTPASISAAVANHKGGTIVTEGGQVYLQAAALNQAMATVFQSGSIDTTGVQGGQVHVLADGGRIRVDGQIKANSTGTDDKGQPKAGGDIFIGRDRDTNVLAAVGDVRGATLESKGGFVETSGDHLKTDGITVKTKDWLLDPSDITISNSADSNVTGASPADITPNGGTGTSSIVNVGTIQTAINSGTNVTIKTTNASNPSGAGNITITDALSLNNTGAQDTTLSLVADNGIIQNAAITATGTKLVHISMTANGNFQGNSAASASSQGITLNAGITSNGNITLTGNNQSGAAAGAGAGVHINGQTLNAGSSDVTVTGTATNSNGIYTNSATTIRGRNITLNGTANTTTAASVGRGIYLFRDGTTTIASTNNLAITGTISGAGIGNGIFINGSNVGSAVLMTAGGTATIKGIQTGNASNTSSTLSLAGFRVNATGDVTLQAEAASSNSLAIYMNREAGSLNGYDDTWRMQVRSSGGNVLIQSNQGAVLGQDINGGVTISGRNVTLDNTGAGMTVNGVANANGGSINATTGAITLGSGTSTYTAAVSNGWAGSWVPLGVSLNGQNSTANLTATNNLTIGGSSSAAQGVVVGTSITVGGNIQLASRTSAANIAGLTTSQALTAAGHIGLTGESTNASPGVGLNIGSTVSTTGNGSTTTLTSATGAVSGAGNITTAVSNTGAITVNSGTAGILSGVISGGGSLVKQGAGTISITGTNTFTGTTTISAGTLQLGNGGTTGSLGTNTGEITNNGTLAYNRSNNLTVSNTISGTGALMQAGTGTTILTANNSYSGTTTVSGGTLQVGNGGTTGTLGTGGAVTLSNNAVLSYVRSADTTIANNIAGTGSVSASITGAGSDLAVSHAITLTAGTVNLAADGHLSLAQGITTTNTTTNALVMNAGAAANAGTSTGGDISFTGSGAVSVGAGGRATLFTGSLSGSNGLGITVGNNRYNSDELTSNYTAALVSGTFAIYREAPTLNVRFNDASKTYDALAFTGGNGLSVVSGLVKGDTTTTFSGITYSGTAQNATNAGSYAISGTAINSHGYALSYTNGTLTVNKANLVLTGTRQYDATTTFAGQHLTATGVAGQTFSLTGSGHNSNLASKHVANNQNVALNSVTGLSLGASSNGGLAANYNDLSTAGSSVSVSAKTASVNATPTTVTYSGVLQTQNAVSSAGFIAGDAVTFSGLASGINAGTFASNIAVNGADAGNYTIGITNANLVVQKANLVLSGSRAYDGGTTFAGAFLTAAGVNNETFAVTGLGDHSNLTNKNVAANQAVALNSVTGLALGSSSNGGLSTNYNALSTAASSVSLSLKSASVTGTSTQLVYNGDVQTQQAATTSGFVGGDLITVSGLASGKNAGTYTSQLLVGGADAANYSVGYNNANLVIGKASLTATANSSTVTYNAESQSVAGFTVTGLLGSDQISDLTGLSASGALGTRAGSYTNFMTSGAQTNYVVNAVNGTLTINKAPLTVTGHSASVTYNGFDQSVSGFSVSGLMGTDTVGSLSTLQATGAIGKNAGIYTNTVTAGTENNYTVTAVNGTLTIGKAALTATGNSAQVTYNGASQSLSGFTLTGLLGADTAADITRVSASGASGTDAGSYTNTVQVGTEANYTVTPVNGFLSIGKANLILSGSRVYDRTTSFAGGFLTASGVAGQTFSVSGAGDASNLASKNVQSSQSLSSVTGLSLGASTNGGLSSNYNALSATGSSVSVTPLSASVSGTAASVVYNGSTQNQAVTSSGFIAGDDVVISGWASGKAAGTYGSSLSLTGADAANYSVTFNNANWVITPAPLVVTATAVSKTYDGKLKATGTGTVGVLAGATAGEAVLSAGVQSFLDKDAGTGKTVRASGLKIKDATGQDVTANYAINYVDNTSSTINKAMLTITANDDARFVTQTDAVGFNGVSYAGLVGGETSSVLGGSLTIARTNAATQDAGSYSGVLVPSGLTSNNYQISFANGNYTIIPANQLLIRTANLTGSNSVAFGSATPFDATAQYLDGNNQVIHTLSRTGSNGLFIFSDGANGAVSVALKPYNGASLASTSSSGHTVVGNYAIRDVRPLVTGGNFSGSPIFVGALQVDPKAVTPYATGVTKTYDGTTSMNNVVVGLTGKMGNDDLSISGSGAFAQRHVGTGLAYTISDVVLAGADAANYYLMGASNSFSGNDGVISRAPLVISTANVVKTYDRTTSALGQAVAVQGTQLFSGDSFSGGTFAFTNANAGSGNKTVTVSGVAVNDGNGGGNYSISFANNTSSTIQARALQANFAASSKVYDGTDTAQVTGNTADVIAGDTVFLVKTGAVFNDKNVGTGKSVTVSGIGLAGADAANYSLQNTSALSSADITPKPLTASFTTSARAYDGSTTATVLGSSTDKVAGDNLVFNVSSAHFASADAGVNKQVTLTGLSLGGVDAGNYALQNTSATSTGTINRRDVSLTGLTAANKVYDGTTSAVITSGVIATGVTGESLNVTGTGAFASKLVGNNKSVTVADVSALTKVNGTGHWNNYRLVTTGSLSASANITPAPLTVTANAVNKTYDGLLTASGSGTVGALAGAGDSVSSFGVQSFLDKNVGIGNKVVRASGVTIKDAANADMMGNYQITYVDSLTGSIVRAPLTVKINNTSMFVTQVPDIAVDNGFSVTGLVNGESASSVLGPMSRRYTGAPNVPVGNYAGVFDLSATPSAANYSVSVQKGDLTVVPADKLLIHVGSGSEAYGVLTAANAGSASSSVMAQYCLVASDCNGANIANLAMTRQGSRWTATDASNSTISFDTEVNTAGRLSAGGFVNAGHYVWTASGLTTTGALNFNGTAINAGVLTVNPKLLSLGAGNVTKVYDGTNALVGRALTPDGAMPADAINVVSTGGSFAGKTVGQHGFTLTGLKLQGADWANYGLAGENVTGTGLITPKALQWFASVEDKVYDGNTSAVLRSLALSGIVDGDHVNATGGTAHYASKNVARDAAGQVQSQDVTVSGVVLIGASASNYSLLTTSLVTRATITPRKLSVIGTQVADKKEDGSVRADVRLGVLSGLVGSEQLRALASGQFRTPGAGQNQPVDVIYSLQDGENGGKAGNYELMGQTLKASITPVNALQMPRTEAPVASESTRSRVFFDQSRWASFAPAQSSEGRKGERSVDSSTCSAQTPNNCSCNVDMGTGVEICLPVRDR